MRSSESDAPAAKPSNWRFDAASLTQSMPTSRSPTQFNREYRRLFGAPPGQDATRLRTDTLRPVSP